MAELPSVPTTKQELITVIETLLAVIKGSVETVKLGSDDQGKSIDVICVGEEKANLLQNWLPARVLGHKVFILTTTPLTEQDYIVQMTQGLE